MGYFDWSFVIKSGHFRWSKVTQWSIVPVYRLDVFRSHMCWSFVNYEHLYWTFLLFPFCSERGR